MAILGDSTITDLSVINDMQVNGLFTKPLIIKSSINGSYNEGIRITKSSNNWAGMVIGCNAGSTSGAPSEQGGWFIANDTSNRLIINNTDSGTTNSSIWINTDKTVNIGKATITTLNGVTVGSSPKFTDTVYTHPTSAGNIHLPSGGASGNFLKWSSAGTGKWESLTKTEITTALGYTPPTTNTTYSAGTGLSLSGNTFNHSNSVTAGTAGTSSATSGSTLAVPYVTYDAQGHITATGTHTHTVSGFLTAHQTIKQNGVTGATGNCYGVCSTAAGTAAKAVSITAGTPTLEAGLKVTVKFTHANTAGTPTLNVNSLGAKNIFHNGAQITPGANKALLAGVCDFVYDGTQFHLVGNYIDTTYSGSNGISLSGTTFSNSGVRSIATGSANGTISVNTNGTAADVAVKGLGTGAYAAAYVHPSYTARTGKPTADATPAFGGTVTVSQITSDSLGHVTGATDRTITIPATAMTGASSSAAGAKGLVPAPAAGDQAKFLRADATWAVPTDTTYSAGTGLSLSGTTFNHASSVTAGTAGTSSATSGATLAVPYVTYNASGHITAAGTHTHTISGFLTAHQTIKQDAVTGATANRFGTCSTAAATAAKAVSITAGTPTLEAGLKVTVKFTYANTANSPTLNVNSLGAKNIFHNGVQITTGANKALLAGVCDFVYDGTQFHLVGNYIDTNTTYTHPSYTARTGKPTADATPAFGGTFTVSQITSDSTGHVTGATDRTITIPATAMTGASSSAAGAKGLVPAPAAGDQAKFLRADATWQPANNYTHPSDGGNTGSFGPSDNASPAHGGTFSVPYVTINGAGHVIAASTKTITLPAAPTSVTSASKLTTARAIDGVNFDGTAAITHFGTCDTAAATAAKTVPCTNYTLVTGSRIVVKFTVTNTAASPTLNVNSTGAKAIQYRGSAISAGYLAANRTYEFIYDGTNYQLVGDLDTNTQTITGVKGNSESSYRTGNVNLTAANIGAATSDHNHTGVYTPYAASVGSNHKFIYTNSSGVLTAANFEIWVTD